MKKDFIPYEQALELKGLGFGEPCFGKYYTLNGKTWKLAINKEYYLLDELYDIGSKFTISAPIFSQAFRWFREKCGLNHFVELDVDCKPNYYNAHVQCSLVYHGDNYEEAELACLKKLIEILTKTA
jgi:hypothetical protein